MTPTPAIQRKASIMLAFAVYLIGISAVIFEKAVVDDLRKHGSKDYCYGFPSSRCRYFNLTPLHLMRDPTTLLMMAGAFAVVASITSLCNIVLVPRLVTGKRRPDDQKVCSDNPPRSNEYKI